MVVLMLSRQDLISSDHSSPSRNHKLFVFAGKPIFSVDIHPDGTKFATGGQGMVHCYCARMNFMFVLGLCTIIEK